MSKKPLYRVLAQTVQAWRNSVESGNTEWQGRHWERVKRLVREHMPSGSGLDNGVRISGESTGERLVFSTSFHHMNDGGMYDGWTEHTVDVRGSLAFGLQIKISGRNRNDIKDHLGEIFHAALTAEIDESEGG